MNEFENLRTNPIDRRRFLARMSAAGMGVAAIALFEGRPAMAQNAITPDRKTVSQFAGIPGRNINEQILNYALTLEIIEADLYRQALNKASGLPLTDPLRANSGAYALQISGGGLTGPDAAAGFKYLVDFSYVEAAHRDFLRTAISAGGGTPVTANAKGYAFPGGPSSNLESLLRDDILPLEETGVRAYLGALPSFTDLDLAQVAGGIYSTEARHSAAIEYILGIDPGPTPMRHDLKVTATYPAPNTFEYFLQPSRVVSRVSGYFL